MSNIHCLNSIPYKDRLLDRHLCLNLYPCVIKVQSVSPYTTTNKDTLLSFCYPYHYTVFFTYTYLSDEN